MTRTPAAILEAAAHALTEDSPVHVPGHARVAEVAVGEYGLTISVCDQHNDPDNPPKSAGAHDHCSSCSFIGVHVYDRAFADQLVALINARPQLTALLKGAADQARSSRVKVKVAPALAVARALLGEA